MSTTEITHFEQWQMIILRQEGEDWPDQPVPWSQTGRLYRPEKLNVIITRGAEHPQGSVTGRRILKDGQPSHGRATWGTYGTRFPAWAQEIIERERRAHDLGPGTTSCGW